MTDSEKCPICDKRGKRPCPATGKLICATCCGTHRGSQLNCPSECSFFPFGVAGSQLWQAVNQSWASKSMRYLDTHLGDNTMAGIFQRFLPPGKARRQADVYAVYFPVIYHGLLVHRDAEGKRALDHWEAADWAELNNDEKVLMAYRRNSYVTVIESQRPADGPFVECIDLFDPERKPFRIVAPSTSGSMPRFTRLLTWLTHYPDFSRLGGLSFQVADLLWPIWRQKLDERVAQEQQTRPDLSRKEFLAETISECGVWLEKLAAQAQEQMFESLGVHSCVAEFRLTIPMSEAKAILESKPDFRTDVPRPITGFHTPPHFYAWVAQGASEGFAKEATIVLPDEGGGNAALLGTVRLYPNSLSIETYSKAIFQFVRKMVEDYFGAGALFDKESIVNSGQQLLQREKLWPTAGGLTSASKAAVESPGTAPGISAQAHKERYDHALNEPVKALGNLAPRAAATHPDLRPKLVEWLKGQIHYLEVVNRRDGQNLNIDWVLDELGVPELK